MSVDSTLLGYQRNYTFYWPPLSVIHSISTRWQHDQHNRKCLARVSSNWVVEVL